MQKSLSKKKYFEIYNSQTRVCNCDVKLATVQMFERELEFAFVTRRPYCPGRPKKLCFTTPSLAVKTVGARLRVVKQSFFGRRGQYGRRVTKENSLKCVLQAKKLIREKSSKKNLLLRKANFTRKTEPNSAGKVYYR